MDNLNLRQTNSPDTGTDHDPLSGDSFADSHSSPQPQASSGSGLHPLNPKREKDWQTPQTTYQVPLPDNEPEPMPVESTHSIRAFVGLILGIAGISGWCYPVIGFAVTLAGIIFSASGLKTPKRGVAILGLALSIAFLSLTFGHVIANFIKGSNSNLWYMYG